jgi:hypothetical protein
MIALALGVALSAPACAAHVGQSRPRHVVHVYTFPLDLPGDTKVCVEARWQGPPPACITLARLRALARDVEAN